ncbi:uncharacterized protein N7511_008508 [Penicillium nucicola]|uniref:uncharacterized protein n=1 Tax=Penicillium nucicola TaxID=1850975 RepID=UPI0025450529|nr:uncharacterized protein N7511_008508 [Penicillium nucicola]KAJ5751543.1 hypothetical protein N7511_008508 [Penicillium nucicola]
MDSVEGKLMHRKTTFGAIFPYNGSLYTVKGALNVSLPSGDLEVTVKFTPDADMTVQPRELTGSFGPEKIRIKLDDKVLIEGSLKDAVEVETSLRGTAKWVFV